MFTDVFKIDQQQRILEPCWSTSPPQSLLMILQLSEHFVWKICLWVHAECVRQSPATNRTTAGNPVHRRQIGISTFLETVVHSAAQRTCLDVSVHHSSFVYVAQVVKHSQSKLLELNSRNMTHSMPPPDLCIQVPACFIAC